MMSIFSVWALAVIVVSSSLAIGFVVAWMFRVLARPSVEPNPSVPIQERSLQPWPWLTHERLSLWQWHVMWSGVSIPILRWMLIIIVIGSALLLSVSWEWAILFAVVMIVVISVWIFRASMQRRAKCEEQLPDAIDALVQGLRAGFALPQSLAIVERELNAPVSRLFGALARADKYRLPFIDALQMVDAQVRNTEWSLVTDALRLQEQSGGNMVPVLSSLASGMRDRLRVEHEVQTATASGKFSGLLIALLAPLSFVLFSVFSPEYIAVLIHQPIGQLLLACGVILELIGFFWIWRITTIDY